MDKAEWGNLQSVDLQEEQDLQFVEDEPAQIQQVDSIILEETKNLEVQQRSFEITVQIQSGITQYYESIQYTIHSKVQGNDAHKVTRTYRHFEWLNNALKQQFLGIIIPSVPEKNLLAKLNIVDQTSQIRDKRFFQLIEFLRKVVEHPKLSQSELLDIFFTGSLESIQNELIKLDQFKSYASQMGNLITVTGTSAIDLAKGTIKYFSGFLKETTVSNKFIMPDLENNNEINNLFDSWEDLMISEGERVKKIYENLNQIVINKLEQIEEMKKMSKTMSQIGQFSQITNQIEGQIYVQETITTGIRQKVLYKFEVFYFVIKQLYLFDIIESQNIIKKRNQLITQIKQQTKIYNDTETAYNDKLKLQPILMENTKKVKQLESKFSQDIERFGQDLNQQLIKLLQLYNSEMKKQYSELQNVWED